MVMKILIVSDTHRREENLERVLMAEKPIDLLIHLGDVEGSEDYITAIAECPTEMVSGNNDFFSHLPREKEIFIGELRVMLTHGHYYRVSLELGDLEEEARLRGVDVVMFGHTHRPVLMEKQGLTILNPGSLTYPRQEGRRASYIVMELEGDRKASYQIKYL